MFKQRSDFFKNMLTLLSGSALSQLVPFIILPVLQKWFYGPADFGELALYSSVTMLLAHIAAMKYEFAIVNARRKGEAENIFVGAMIISFVFSLLVSLVFLIFGDMVARLFSLYKIQKLFYLVPFSVFFFSAFEIFNYWNNWKKNYSTIATGKIVKTMSAESAKLSFGYFKSTFNGLVAGRVIGEIASSLWMFVRFLRKDLSSFHFSGIADIKADLKRNYRFPAFTMPSVLISNLINLVFIGLFSKYFGMEKTGVIGISVVYVSVAFGLISQSFSQVFYKELSDTQGKKALIRLYLGNAKYLVIISILAILFVQIIPSSWVAALLGDKWIDLMPTLKILIFSYAVSFITSSLSFIYMRVSKQKQMLLMDMLHLLLVAGSIFGGYRFFGTFEATLISYTAAQVIYYGFAFLIAIVFIRNMEEG